MNALCDRSCIKKFAQILFKLVSTMGWFVVDYFIVPKSSFLPIIRLFVMCFTTLLMRQSLFPFPWIRAHLPYSLCFHRMRQQWQCASSKPLPQETYGFPLDFCASATSTRMMCLMFWTEHKGHVEQTLQLTCLKLSSALCPPPGFSNKAASLHLQG
jgi:hypothetical protein